MSKWITVTILAASAGLAQERPVFEVASVKPANPEVRSIGMFALPGGRISITKLTLKQLVQDAYSVQPFQISGGVCLDVARRFR